MSIPLSWAGARNLDAQLERDVVQDRLRVIKQLGIQRIQTSIWVFAYVGDLQYVPIDQRSYSNPGKEFRAADFIRCDNTASMTDKSFDYRSFLTCEVFEQSLQLVSLVPALAPLIPRRLNRARRDLGDGENDDGNDYR